MADISIQFASGRVNLSGIPIEFSKDAIFEPSNGQGDLSKAA